MPPTPRSTAAIHLRRSSRRLAALLTVSGLAVGGGAAAVGSGATEPGADPAPTSDRPNVLVLMTDDAALSDMSAMPRTRALLGAEGTTFTHAISTFPLCSPARATLLTGQLPHNHHVLGNGRPWGGVQKLDEAQTLPVWLQAAGYRTTLLGKYLNGYPAAGEETSIPPGWDHWQVPVEGAYRYRNSTINTDGVLGAERRYQTRYLGDSVLARLDAEAEHPEQPFFLWANYLAPHVGKPVEPGDPVDEHGRVVPTPAVEDRYRGTEADRQVPRTEAFVEDDMSDKAPFMRRQKQRPAARYDALLQQRLESLRSVDDSIARVVARLKALDLWDDTLVIFASDNGYLTGQHRWDQKFVGYEESIRVPLIIHGPGFDTAADRDQLVNDADLTSTILEATGARPGVAQDGLALQPLAADPSEAAGRVHLLESGGWPYPGLEHLYRGVRTPDGFVYLRWFDRTEEVYDLATDPDQSDGTIDAVEQQRLPALRRALQALKKCAGDECTSVRLDAAAPQ